MIKKLLPAVGAMLAIASFSGAAQAATTISTNKFTAANMNIVAGTDGTYSANFGRSGIVAGKFEDTYSFTLPQYLLGSATLSTSAVKVGGKDDLDITSVFFNGVKLAATKSKKDQNESFVINDVLVKAGQLNTIVITGMGRGNGSYGAQAVFAPVPEPASWAMMIGGFGFAGAAMRRRSARTTRAALA